MTQVWIHFYKLLVAVVVCNATRSALLSNMTVVSLTTRYPYLKYILYVAVCTLVSLHCTGVQRCEAPKAMVDGG